VAELIPMGSIPAHYAARLPDRICITYPEGSLTWLELEQRSTGRAHVLREIGVEADDLVTVSLPNGLEFHETMFALWKLGATPHVISSALTVTEIRELVALARPRVVIGLTQDQAAGHRAIPGSMNPVAGPYRPFEARVARYWRALSSGGSTGRPKIVVDHNPSVWGFEFPMVEMPRDSCILNPGPLHHSSPFAWSHIALFQNNHVVGMERFDPLETLTLIERHRVTWVSMVPTMMHRIWSLPANVRTSFDLSSLRTMLHLAAPMPAWLKERWIEWLGPERILEVYSGTEAIGATQITGTEWLAHKGSVGRSIDSELRILNDDGERCTPGQIGNVCFAATPGAAARSHYIGAEPVFVAAGWQTLGDLGWIDEDGYLYLADRRADMIISGGANIFPAEVEAVLLEHPDVDGAVVIGLPDEDMGQVVHALVHARKSAQERLDETSLRAFVASRLVRYKHPRSYEFVVDPLRNDAGKIRRSDLARERSKSNNSASRRSPETP